MITIELLAKRLFGATVILPINAIRLALICARLVQALVSAHSIMMRKQPGSVCVFYKKTIKATR